MSVAEIDEKTCKEALDFCNIFYEAVDRKRDKSVHLYTSENPTLVWNGNPVEGQDNIFRFISSLPETNHFVTSMDAHSIPSHLSDLQGAIVVLCAGSVTVGEKEHAFTQSFTLAVEDGKYKIRADRFRYVD